MNELYFNLEKIVKEIAEKSCEKAFRRFFDLYYPKLLHLAFSILQNDEVAQDVVLEVFEKVWEQRTNLTEIESINKYLFVLVKNKSIDQLRKRKELVVLESTESGLYEKVLLDHPENILLDKELAEKISVAIMHLPEKCRLVYRLIKEDGLKYKEVSELLNLSPKTIDNHVSNAMSRIRQEISAYLNETRSYPWKVIRSILMLLTI